MGRNRSFIFFATGQTVSLLGIYMSAVALPWYVLTTTNSPTRMALVLFAQTIPIALFGIPAGVLVDRVNLKRLMVILDAGRAVSIGLIPVLAWMNALDYWMIVALAFTAGLLAAPYHGAKLALIPALVGEEEADLATANTILHTGMNGMSIGGPVLAGLLIPLIGNGAVLLVDAGSYAAAAILIGLWVRHEHSGVPETERSHPWSEMLEGVRYAWGNDFVRLTLVLGALAGLAFWLAFDAGMPVFTRDILGKGPETLGFLMGAWGVGAVAGMGVFGLADKRISIPRVVKLTITLTCLALAAAVPPLTQALVASAAGFFFAGLFDGPSGVMVHTILQHHTPARLRGRVSSAFYALLHTVAPAGLLAAGPVMERWGSLPVMWAVAVAFALCALAAANLAWKTRGEAVPEVGPEILTEPEPRLV